jgi:hypothetical protein
MSAREMPSAVKPEPSRVHRAAFAFSISCLSRLLILRDRLFGWTRCGRVPEGIDERASRCTVASGPYLLDAVLVEPAGVPARAALLICHGIAETVEQWFGVQQLLAARGVASLVFDYAGYGRSTGHPDWEQFEQDAIASCGALRELRPELPVSVLGFSLGSGVAVAAIDRLPAQRLVLCQAFTSFRNAAVAGGFPRILAGLVPPIWQAQSALEKCQLPVLVVHGEKDRLFPVAMARQLAAWCRPRAGIVLVPGSAHNQPFRKPHLAYWGPIAEWIGA